MTRERTRQTTAVPRRASVDDETLSQPTITDQIRVRLTWLLVFRAILMTVMLVTAIVLRFTSSGSLFAGSAVALYVVAAISYASVLAGALWMKRHGTQRIRELAYAQLIFDVLVAATVVVLTGGVESVFVFVFSLTVLNAAAVLQRTGAQAIAAVTTAMYAVIMALEVTGLLEPFGVDQRPRIVEVLPPFLTNTASFVLVAVLGGYLTEQLQKTSERLDVARAQIERIEELYHAVLESLPSGVLTVDQQDRIVYVNGAGAAILGRAPSQLVGRPLHEQAPALTVEQVARAGDARFETQADVDGDDRTIGGSIARLTGFEGIAGRVVVFQDLTELRRLQHDVARAERLAELGRFAAGLAHEIRNPLAAMIGCLQLLKIDSDAAAASAQATNPEEATRMLSIVQREAERLSGLVTEFLTYARPAPPKLEPVPLLASAKETVAAVIPGLDGKVVVDVEGDDTVIATCDAQQVRQALWNLIANAAQAIRGSDEARTGRVLVSVAREDDQAVLRIDDDGPGVAPEIRPRIFEPFFTTRSAGTGLGLATVHQTMVQQGGSLHVHESPLGGARFEVRLPIAGIIV